MPINSDPDDTLPYVLKVDRAKPEDKQAKFQLIFPTAREQRRLSKLYDAAAEATKMKGNDEKAEKVEEDDEKVEAILGEFFKLAVAGWTNLKFRGKPVEYGPDADLVGVLTHAEKWELANAAFAETAMTERDRGNSASAPASGSAHSAEPAGPDGAKTSGSPTSPASGAMAPTSTAPSAEAAAA